MQAQIAKGDLLLELKLKDSRQGVKEITPYGARVESGYQGEVSGIYSASCCGTMEAFVRSDLTFDWEQREVDFTKEGEMITISSHGTGSTPDFKESKSKGECIFMTQSPKFSWLNNKKARIEITSDSTGETRGKIFAL